MPRNPAPTGHHIPVLEIPEWLSQNHVDELLEIAGIFFAALSGGLAGVRKRFDAFGVLVLAWAGSLGGGVLRDVMIGRTPPVGVAHWPFVVTALAAGTIIFFFHPSIERMRRAVIVLDAWALAFFVLVGTTIALDFGAGTLASIVVGMLTGVGGGVLRDILVSEPPLIFVDRQLYAIPAAFGAAATAWLWHLDWLNVWTQAAVVLLVSGFRLVSLRRGWVIPQVGEGLSGRGRFRGRMQQ